MSAERKSELFAELDAILQQCGAVPKPVPKPSPVAVVTRNGEAVRAAEVKVSQADPNARNAVDGVVRVLPPPGCVRLEPEMRERQLRFEESLRQRQRGLDPYGLGHWGPNDD